MKQNLISYEPEVSITTALYIDVKLKYAIYGHGVDPSDIVIVTTWIQTSFVEHNGVRDRRQRMNNCCKESGARVS